MVTPGIEWMIDAHGCRPDALRSRSTLEALFVRVIAELQLRPLTAPVWHEFAGEGGITGVVLLSESHLTCHTFPEAGFAAINLYCCRPRERWAWELVLSDALGATDVQVRCEPRGIGVPATGSRG
jgi:S-adenosylmethionine decarboxylase